MDVMGRRYFQVVWYIEGVGKKEEVLDKGQSTTQQDQFTVGILLIAINTVGEYIDLQVEESNSANYGNMGSL